MKAENPIGVFDSGVGGLAVLREIRRELPAENLLYVADSRHGPYGDKPTAIIEARSIAILEFLINQGAKAIVVACNTATGAAITTLRSSFALPIVAMEPAIKPAAALTRSGVVAVLATTRTVTSDNMAKLRARFGSQVNILLQACPGLAEIVESGDTSSDQARALVTKYVQPLLDQGADTLVLGCTHYPFLASLIAEVAGPSVSIVDPAPAVARELRRRLDQISLLSQRGAAGTERFWSSAATDKLRQLISRLWLEDIELLSLESRE